MAEIYKDGDLIRVEQGRREPEVSVVVPIYNVEKYLRNCLDSLLVQTIKNFEVICVDDGSPDKCGVICDEYTAKDRRVKVIHQKNRGAGAARNVGLAKAKGRYIAFLDADDMYRPDTLAKIYTHAVTYHADIVIFGAEFTDQDGGFLQNETVNIAPLLGEKPFSAKELPNYLYQITSCNPWNKLFRRDFILDQRISFQTLRTANDLYFTSFAMACAKRIAVLQEPLAIHRMRNKGNLQTQKNETPLDFLTALEKLKTALNSRHLWESLEQSFVNFALEHCVYNYRTLQKAGRQQLLQQSDRLYELLELQQRDEAYYYNRNSYRQVCQWLFFGREHNQMGWFVQIKEFLKRFLPPPTNSFNRELSYLRQYISELNSGLSRNQDERIRNIEIKLGNLEILLDKISTQIVKIGSELKASEKRLENLEKSNRILERKTDEKIDELTKLLGIKLDELENELHEIHSPARRGYNFHEKLSADRYEEELKRNYKIKTGEELHLKNPYTFSEKIQWLKLYDATPIKTRLADKFLVREWIKEKIGEEYLIPLLGVWDSFDEIDFNLLPNRFVLKANHGCKWNVFVEDKQTFDRESAKNKFDHWMKLNYAFNSLELQYMNIPPKIIAEQYIDGLAENNYQFMCFNGEVKFLWTDVGPSNDKRQSYRLTDWNLLEVTLFKPRPFDDNIPKPKSLEKMVEIATILCQGFAHVRVDLYENNDQILFGEMTFTSGSGITYTRPREFEIQMGNWLRLPPKSPIPERLHIGGYLDEYCN